MRIVLSLIVLFGIVVSSLFVHKLMSASSPPPVFQAAATRGDIELRVEATGTLQASRTVDVGTQVSGVVQRMLVDYNSIVRKGQLIAQIDPQLSEAALQSSQAALDRANIDLGAARDTLQTDTLARNREEDLFAHDVATEQERETADLQVESDQAVVDEDQAAVVVATAGVEQARVNLAYCTVRSPIDGVVVSRNADAGQTVQASLSVPSLYVIATDVNALQLSAQIDEADIGMLHPGQAVTFRVDAFPNQTFSGTMQQVRLNATATNNVVTYQAIVSVRNPDLRLLPSMTAKLEVDIARVTNAVRVPNAALRFRPNHDMFDVLGQPPIEAPSPFRTASARVALPPLPLPVRPPTATTTDPSGHPVIDAKYGATPHPESPGTVWTLENNQLRFIPVVVGVSDGTWSELVKGNVTAGESLVTMITTPPKPRTGPGALFTPPRGGFGRYGR